METAEISEELEEIRLTIRRILRPLVVAIYEENPPDIELFCRRYFQRPRRKRESRGKDVEDGYFKSPEDFTDKQEVGKYIQKIEDDNDKTISTTTNIQGSASDSVLTNEKCHRVSLRETSSWDISPNRSKFEGRRMDLTDDLSDAKCGIGDQPCHEITASEGYSVNDAKSGDENLLQEIKDSVFENENIVPPDAKMQCSDVLPSAPPYDNHDPKLENIENGFKNAEKSDDEIEVLFGTNNSKFEEKEIKFDGANCSHSDGQKDAGDPKINTKLLSLNSSVCYNPHLNETSIKQDFSSRSKSSEDSDFEKGTTADVSDLDGQFSNTPQDIAQKFNSAETSLDVEFQKAEEITDQMGDLSLMEDLKEEDSLNFDAAKEDANLCDENFKSEKIDPHFDVSENRQLKKDSFIQQKKLYDDDNNQSRSSVSVDEEWKKKWYEAHPCLNNSSNRLGQTSQRMRMGTEVYVDDHTNSTINTIGEAGDVPPYSFRHTPQNNLNRNFKLFESDSREEGNVNFSPIQEENHSQEKLTADETQRRKNKKLSFNNLDKYSTRTKMSKSCSTKVTHTWSKMSQQQARYLETEKQVLKLLKESNLNGTISKDTESTGNFKTSPSQALHNELSEIVVEKQTNKNTYDIDVNNESEKTPNTLLKDSKEKIFEEKIKDIAHKKIQSSSILKNDLSMANKSENTNEHVSNIDNKCVENFNTLNEADSGTFETKPKACHEANKSIVSVSENQTDPEENKLKYTDTYFSSHEDKIDRNDGKNAGSKNSTLKFTRNEDLISEVKDEIRAYQRMDNSSKVEPGLDAAGGDFTLPNVNEEENDDDVNGNENEQLNSPDYARRTSSPAHQEVTVEYVQEIIERVTQQDSLTDSYEGLNFSSISDSSYSDMESDYSDAEDLNVYSEVSGP